MRPRFTSENTGDIGLIDVVSGGDGLLSLTRRSAEVDVNDITLSQFRPMMPFSASIPTLLCHVARVIGRCPEEQMINANARWVIAGMENPETLGDRPVLQFPRPAVGKTDAPVGGAVDAVPTIHPPRPHPTLAGRVHFRPEALHNVVLSDLDRCGSGIAVAPPAAVVGVTQPSRKSRTLAWLNRTCHAFILPDMSSRRTAP